MANDLSQRYIASPRAIYTRLDSNKFANVFCNIVIDEHGSLLDILQRYLRETRAASARCCERD